MICYSVILYGLFQITWISISSTIRNWIFIGSVCFFIIPAMAQPEIVSYEQNENTSFYLCRGCRTHIALRQELIYKVHILHMFLVMFLSLFILEVKHKMQINTWWKDCHFIFSDEHCFFYFSCELMTKLILAFDWRFRLLFLLIDIFWISCWVLHYQPQNSWWNLKIN